MKKLTLKKEVVSILDGNEMNQVKGRGTFAGCYSDLATCGCPPPVEQVAVAVGLKLGTIGATVVVTQK